MTNIKHTPWAYNEVPQAHKTNVEDSTGAIVARVRSEENAAFIVRAVNCHDELVHALQLYFDEMEIGDEGQRDMENFERIAKAALSKVRGEA